MSRKLIREAYHSKQETGTVSGANRTYPVKDKRIVAELSRMLKSEVRFASPLTQEGQWWSMRVAPAECLQGDRGYHVRGPGTEVTPGETGLLQSGWDRRAIHVFYIVLFSPSHRDDTVLVIYVEFGVWGGREVCHKFNTLTPLWLL